MLFQNDDSRLPAPWRAEKDARRGYVVRDARWRASHCAELCEQEIGKVLSKLIKRF
jgi:hypothetical protein